MADQNTIQRYLAYLEDERNSAALYEAAAKAEENPKLSEVYRRFTDAEHNHARRWEGKLKELGVTPPPFRPSWRTRILIWAARRFGTQAVLPAMTAAENQGSHGYGQEKDAQDLAPTERSHARLLRQISRSTGGLEGSAVAQIEGRHRSAGGNALRAAVLGANDGLVSNFSLVMGVAGAAIPAETILLTGLAGLLAGAISMALGEWISVQSSRELFSRQIETEREEIAMFPEEEAEELALIYQARGLQEEPARELASRIMSDREGALDTLARDELGIDPEELGGSAWEAAFTSFFLFALGAIIPVLPYIFLEGWVAVLTSTGLSALGLFAIGAAITLYTGRSALVSGLRQVVFGLAAAAITYIIGNWIGVSLAG